MHWFKLEDKFRHSRNSARRQDGFGVFEILAALAIVSLITIGLAPTVAYYRATPQVNEAASHLEKVSLAAAHYVNDHHANLISTLPLDGGATIITLDTLRNGGYFSPALADRNPYGQQYSLRVRYVTQGAGANTRQVLEPLVVTHGGHAIADQELMRISAKVENGGAIRSSSPALATGNSGSWEVSMADFGGSPGAGYLAAGLFYSDAGMVEDYLYRNEVPGRPEVNRMNTAINMDGNAIEAAATVETGEAHLTRVVTEASACSPEGALARNSAGVPMSCQSGTWRQTASFQWVGGQGQRLQMTAANGQSMWLQNENGRFRWVDGNWTRELGSMDQNGNLRAAGRVSSGEYLQIGGTAVEGTGCSPNGLVGRTAAGLILSCQSGIWFKQYRPASVDTIATEPNNMPDPHYGVCAADPKKAQGTVEWAIVCGTRTCRNRGYTGGLVQEWSGAHWSSPVTLTCF